MLRFKFEVSRIECMKYSIAKLWHMMFKKLSVPKILILSFLFLILSGTFFLMLPISNIGEPLPFIDNLFTATSATCVTGLLTTTVIEQYNLFGRFIILLLIQFGGLGLMTFISVMLLLMNAKLDFKERMLLKDALNKMDFEDIEHYVISIFKYTFVFEGVGAIILASNFYFTGRFGFAESLAQGVFLSISAFCNAGIDCFGSTSLVAFQSNPVVVLTVAALIILGGIGFAIWFDYHQHLRILIKTRDHLQHLRSRLRIHTKLVTSVTLTLLISGTILIFILEYNNALNGLTLSDKILNAFFSSTTLRTAGFFTIDFSILKRSTELLMILFMLIGGSPGGTAGGIKTTTFFLLLLIVFTEMKNERHMRIFKHHVKKRNFIKAYTVLFYYLLAIFMAWFIMLLTESFDSLDILFEIVSAIGTVGLTTGITGSLSTIGKCVIIFLMFIGRVGPITIAYTFTTESKSVQNMIQYPKTEIIVG